MWFVFALGSALFAALTSILAKVGIEGVNSTLATAIRTVVVLAMSWGMVFLTRAQGGHGGDQPPELALPHPIGAGHRGVLAVLLPGPAAWPGLSGGVHRQAQRGDHLVLAFVFLHEPFTAKSMVGCALVAAGTLFMVL